MPLQLRDRLLSTADTYDGDELTAPIIAPIQTELRFVRTVSLSTDLDRTRASLHLFHRFDFYSWFYVCFIFISFSET